MRPNHWSWGTATAAQRSFFNSDSEDCKLFANVLFSQNKMWFTDVRSKCWWYHNKLHVVETLLQLDIYLGMDIIWYELKVCVWLSCIQVWYIFLHSGDVTIAHINYNCDLLTQNIATLVCQSKHLDVSTSLFTLDLEWEIHTPNHDNITFLSGHCQHRTAQTSRWRII